MPQKSINVVFITFHFYQNIQFWVCRDGFLESFLEHLRDLGLIFCSLGGCRNFIESSADILTFSWGAQVEATTPREANRMIQDGSRKVSILLPARYKLIWGRQGG